MIRFKKMICATDFSGPAMRALDYARALAEKFGAELTVVNVVDTVPTGAPPVGGSPVATTLNVAEHQKMLTRTARQNLDELLEKHGSPDLAIRKHVAEGRPSAEIVQLAEEEGADLIVLGTQGHGRLHRFLFGSVAERVVRSAPCPVLTVGPEEDD
jgi:nucleotide-binding universal stress UspA family protein